MTNTTLPDEVLKSDALGPVRTPRVRREALVEEFEKSRVIAKKFADNYQTFTSQVQARLKIWYWNGTGPWLRIKQLEKGTFSWPKVIDPQAAKLKLAPEALAMLTDGIDLRRARLRPRYERE